MNRLKYEQEYHSMLENHRHSIRPIIASSEEVSHIAKALRGIWYMTFWNFEEKGIITKALNDLLAGKNIIPLLETLKTAISVKKNHADFDSQKQFLEDAIETLKENK